MALSNKKDQADRPVQSVLVDNQEAVAGAKRVLSDCYDTYRAILSGNYKTDLYSRGRLRARIWEIEQMFGVRGVFLSAAGQDQFIYETYFRNKKNGVYLEIGGYDGWRGSNCYFFEKTLNWKGAIVEASPTWVKEIGKYRNAEVVHAAISDSNGYAEFVDVISGATQMGGLSRNYFGPRLPQVRAYPGHEERQVTIPAMTLGTLLNSLNMKQVDYCSIDVEGAEFSILKDFEFHNYDISVFSIENALGIHDASVKEVLTSSGYQLTDVIGDDEIYVKNGFNPLAGN